MLMQVEFQSLIYGNLTVSNIVIILAQSSIADGESFLVIFHVFLYLSELIFASLATKTFSINFQLYINNKFKFKLVTFSLASHLIVAIATYPKATVARPRI